MVKKKKRARDRDRPSKQGPLIFVIAGIAVLFLCCVGIGGAGSVWYFRERIGPPDKGGANRDLVVRDGNKKGGNQGGDPNRIVIDSQDLSREIGSGALQATNKYNGKTLEITGEVARVLDLEYFSLKGVPVPGNTVPFNLLCRVGPESYDKVARFSIGQRVKVITKGDYRFAGHIMGDVTVTELEPSKLVVVPALTLYKEGLASEAAFKKKYAAGVIVSGTVTKAYKAAQFTPEKKVVMNIYLVEMDVGKGFGERLTVRLSELSRPIVETMNVQPGSKLEFRCDSTVTVTVGTVSLGDGLIVR